jgi:uncharacterized protein
MASALRLNAVELLRRPGSDRQVEITVPLTELGIDGDPRFEPDARAEVRLRLESLSDGIVVEGEVAVEWHGTCRRCLADTGGRTGSQVRELYQRELTDPDAFELEGEMLDLAPLVRELVLLDAPTAPLCRPDCAGLCPTCGTDRNLAPCDCAPPSADPRWDGLSALREVLAPERGDG